MRLSTQTLFTAIATLIATSACGGDDAPGRDTPRNTARDAGETANETDAGTDSAAADNEGDEGDDEKDEPATDDDDDRRADSGNDDVTADEDAGAAQADSGNTTPEQSADAGAENLDAGQQGTDADAIENSASAAVIAFAYAFDHDAVEPYTPAEDYTYNAAAGAVSIEREGEGLYAISFAGLDLAGANVQATAYSFSGYCVADGWLGETAHVSCYNNAGDVSDARFTLAVVKAGAESTARISAYAFAGDNDNASYTPLANYSYNSAAGAISATRSAAGTYRVEFEGTTLNSGNVQVSSYNSANHCNVQTWGTSGVNVRCYSPAGTLTDTSYLVTVIQTGAVSSKEIVGYAWAAQSDSASYDLSDDPSSFNSTAGAITASRVTTGRYTLTLEGQALSTANIKVTSYDAAHFCSVQSFAGAAINIRCYDADGAAADTRYSVLVMK